MPETHARFELTSEGEAFRVYANGFEPRPGSERYIATINLAGGAVVEDVGPGIPDNAVRAAATAAAAVSALNSYVGLGDAGMLDSYTADDEIGGGLRLHWPVRHKAQLMTVDALAAIARSDRYPALPDRLAAINELARRAALAGPHS